MQGKRIDTLPMARVLWPECDSHSQTALMYYLEGATLETRAALRGAHSALADVGFCSTILEHIIAGLGVRTLAALYEASELARIPSSMSFGKFKGEPISNVDRGWASWYAKQADTDRYLIIALRNAGKL
jgi:exodeoxyribonuclease X